MVRPVSRAAALGVCFVAACLSAPERPGDDLPAVRYIRYQLKVADLNDDDRDDLILLNSPGAGEPAAVWIVLGRSSGFLTIVDHELSIGDLEPVALAVGDFMDGASPDAPDLAVLAREAAGGGTLIVYPGDGMGGFGAPLSKALPEFQVGGGTVEMPEPVFVTLAKIRGMADQDVVIGDLDEVYYVAPTEWTAGELATAPVTRVEYTGGTANEALAAHSETADRDDLLLVENQKVLWYRNTGSGLETMPVLDDDAFDNGARTTRLFDLDEDDLPEIATTWSGGVTEVAFTSYDGSPAVRDLVLDPNFELPDAQGDDLWLGDLDGNGDPDLVVVDDIRMGANASMTSIQIAGNLTEADLMIVSTGSEYATRIFDATGARRLAVGDFDGDGRIEIRVFDVELSDYSTRCFVTSPDGFAVFEIEDC